MTTHEATGLASSQERGGSARRPHATRASRCGWIAILLTSAGALLLAQTPAREPLRLVFTRAATDIGNDDDVQAAITKWTEVIGRYLDRGRPVEHRLTVGGAEIATAIASGRADFGVLSPHEYLEIEPHLQADPFLTYQSNNETEVGYVLVARSGIGTVADLTGKRALLFMPNEAPHPARLWLDVLLREAGLPPLKAAFADVREVKKPSQALLPVFFGQADVALVPTSAYSTSTELNPDLGRKLHVIATSPPFLRIVIVVARTHGGAARARWLDGLLKAHEGPETKQVFTIFKIDRFLPCTERSLANVRAIVSRHDALELAALRPASKTPAPAVRRTRSRP